MSILITGAAGFIGHYLVEALRKRMPVNVPAEDRIIDHGSLVGLDLLPMDDMSLDRMVRADITDENRMKDVAEELTRVEYIFHLAAIASPPIAQKNPTLSWSTNVRGTHNVLNLARQVQCKKVIFFSSAHVYGISPRYMPTDENHPLALHDTYTTTKIMGEELCRLFYQNHGLSYTNLRLWNAYGPRQSRDYFIGAKMKQAKKGSLTIRNAGVTKDWVHVRDVAEAAILAMKSDYVGPLNVGTGKETSIETITRRIASAFGDLPVVDENVPDEGPTRMQCDWRRIEKLGWKPTTSFEQGLDELIEIEKRTP